MNSRLQGYIIKSTFKRKKCLPYSECGQFVHLSELQYPFLSLIGRFPHEALVKQLCPVGRQQEDGNQGNINESNMVDSCRTRSDVNCAFGLGLPETLSNSVLLELISVTDFSLN